VGTQMRNAEAEAARNGVDYVDCERQPRAGGSTSRAGARLPAWAGRTVRIPGRSRLRAACGQERRTLGHDPRRSSDGSCHLVTVRRREVVTDYETVGVRNELRFDNGRLPCEYLCTGVQGSAPIGLRHELQANPAGNAGRNPVRCLAGRSSPVRPVCGLAGRSASHGSVRRG
jgi:hypothetical protein